MEHADARRATADSVSSRLKFLNWSGVFFAVLQSVCSAFFALSGVRLLIGLSAFAAATGVLRVADRMHIDAIRIPMMLFAFLGSALNLWALRRVWSLRQNPASKWRQRPVAKQKRRSELLQFAISILTLLLLAVEVTFHHRQFHRF